MVRRSRQHDPKCRLKSSQVNSIYFNHPSQGNSTNYIILGPRDKAAPPTRKQIKEFPSKRVKYLATVYNSVNDSFVPTSNTVQTLQQFNALTSSSNGACAACSTICHPCKLEPLNTTQYHFKHHVNLKQAA